jgi:hypothetical protein
VAVGLQTFSEEVSVVQKQIGQKLNDPVPESLSIQLSELRKEVFTQKTEVAAMSHTVTASQTFVCSGDSKSNCARYQGAETRNRFHFSCAHTWE